MARISLLFSLPLALVLGSLFLSVSGHAPPAPKKGLLSPETVSQIQTLPFTKINAILTLKEKFAPKTAEFKEMFTLCKDYVTYLQTLYKLENPIVDVLGIGKTRYSLMVKSIIAAENSISVKLDKKTSRKLKKSVADLTKAFLQIQQTIVKISAKHNYKPNAKLSLREAMNVVDDVIRFRVSINAFMDVVCSVEEKKVEVKAHARGLTKAVGGVKGSFQGFLSNKGLGLVKRVEFDAAGKMRVAGKAGFRSLNRPHYKHLDSTEA